MLLTLALRVEDGGRVRATLSVPCVLVFDVETDGGSPKQRCIEMAFLVFDAGMREVHRYCEYWRLPPGGKIAMRAQWVHGITEETVAKHGVDPRDGLREFMTWVDRVLAHPDGRVVAHNAAFDAGVVANMLGECGVPRSFSKDDCFCAMRSAAPHAGCVDRVGKRRAPKNAELYTLLHDAPPTWARLHAALDDVRVTARNYAAGKARGWW